MNTDQVKGSLKDAAGKVQQKVGEVVGSTEQQAKGIAKQVEGKAQKAAGDVKEAVENSGEKVRPLMNAKSGIVACAVAMSFLGGASWAQPVAGTATLGVTATEVQAVATGWSLKKSILGKNVYNDEGKSVGKIDDVIVAPDSSISYAIVGAGGFLGMGKHDVAIPVKNFKVQNNKIVLAGATKDALKELPKFEYAKH